jgi:hypothetical protein
MNWLQFAVHWLHVLLGMTWFVNSLLVAAVLVPTLNPLPLPVQREIGGRYSERTRRIFLVLIPLVIVLGFVRGTVLGPISSVDYVFTTTYGITWLVGLLAAIATYLWSKLVIERSLDALNAVPLPADGSTSPALEAALTRVKGVVVLELVGFFVIFTCMILMRFGL